MFPTNDFSQFLGLLRSELTLVLDHQNSFRIKLWQDGESHPVLDDSNTPTVRIETLNASFHLWCNEVVAFF